MSNAVFFQYVSKTEEDLRFLNILCEDAIIEGELFIQSEFQDKSNKYFSEEFISKYLTLCSSYVMDKLSSKYKRELLDYFASTTQVENYIIQRFNRHIKLQVLNKK